MPGSALECLHPAELNTGQCAFHFVHPEVFTGNGKQKHFPIPELHSRVMTNGGTFIDSGPVSDRTPPSPAVITLCCCRLKQPASPKDPTGFRDRAAAGLGTVLYDQQVMTFCHFHEDRHVHGPRACTGIMARVRGVILRSTSSGPGKRIVDFRNDRHGAANKHADAEAI